MSNHNFFAPRGGRFPELAATFCVPRVPLTTARGGRAAFTGRWRRSGETSPVMAEPALKTATASPEAIDRAHLSRMTFGDASLERELLQLFDRQCEVLLSRMDDADAGSVKVLAHTLK